MKDTFRKYLLDDLFQTGKNRFNAYLIGCGGEGGIESYAMTLAAREKGLEATCIGFDLDDEDETMGLPAARREWNELVRVGLVKK